VIRELLQGRWLGHPLHPALVHVPAGLLPAALLFDVLSRAGVGQNAVVQTSFYCIAVGLAAGLVAAPAGLADWLEIKRDKPAYRIGLWHMGLNLLAVVLWAINLALRWETFRWQTRVDGTSLALSVAGTGLLIVSGYFGGRMVFDEGIGVARMSRKRWREVALAGRANVPPES
jgi:uncharacterized membrane protein